MTIAFLSRDTVTFDENSTGAVRNIQASLNSGTTDTGITYSITGGADQALFNINSTTGVLTFIAAPDFESPGDAGGDNVYNVTVTAADTATGMDTATQDLVITVANDVVETSITSGIVSSRDLSTLNGTTGFVINGIDAGDVSGQSVSNAGDINGDGIDDIIIGAFTADPGGATDAGESYVVFGTNSGFAASLDLSTLDGTNGFVINGIDTGDVSGASVSAAGDVNGDGIDDLIIGAYSADPNGNLSGETYVVFGTNSGFAASLDLSTLDGTNGFVINGIDTSDRSGRSVSSAGDVNGDGIDDIIIGSRDADPNGSSSGESYVVFGTNTGFAASLDLSSLDGTNGFVINGIDSFDLSGVSVSSAGDVNGDGFDDLIIGAYRADPNGSDSGESYVVFGQASGFGASLNLSTLDGSNGFVINGVDAGDRAGFSVSSAGDVNGDGFDDLIIGAEAADPNGARSGESYVVFGQAESFGASLNLSTLDGTNGFVINGVGFYDRSGYSVSGAGDINGDGFDDLIIGAPTDSPNGDYSGQTYVVFGAASGFAASLELSALDGTNGLVLNGIDENDYSGRSVSGAGDVNGDGFDDLIIGARYADPNGNYSGETYIVFGGSALQSGNAVPTASDNTITINEDTSRTLTVADFNFADADMADSLQSVRIDTLSVGSGTFRLSGVDVSVSDVITVADITAGNLVYKPGSDDNGSGLLTLTFSVNDGSAFAASTSNFVVNVRDVAEPVPTIPLNIRVDNSNSDGGRTNGTSLDDRIGGTGGNDVLNGANGQDTLIGGRGDDFAIGGNGNDTVYAGPGDMGNDTVQGNRGDDLLGGGGGDDIVVGGDFGFTVKQSNTGDAGSDTLFGGAGDDLLVGGSYNESTMTVVNTGHSGNVLFAGSGNDTVFGDNAEDLILGGSGNDRLEANDGDDTVYGGSGDDTIIGGGGNDTLFGGSGEDTVAGGAGADVIWAGAGDDNLSGGADADTFMFGRTSGNDTVTDFDVGEDTINLSFALGNFASFEDVSAAASETTQNEQSGVLIDLGGNDSVFIIGISLDDLTESTVSF